MKIIENPTFEFEISEYNGEIEDVIKVVETKYSDFKFVVTKPRYQYCIVTIFKKR